MRQTYLIPLAFTMNLIQSINPADEWFGFDEYDLAVLEQADSPETQASGLAMNSTSPGGPMSHPQNSPDRISSPSFEVPYIGSWDVEECKFPDMHSPPEMGRFESSHPRLGEVKIGAGMSIAELASIPGEGPRSLASRAQVQGARVARPGAAKVLSPKRGLSLDVKQKVLRCLIENPDIAPAALVERIQREEPDVLPRHVIDFRHNTVVLTRTSPWFHNWLLEGKVVKWTSEVTARMRRDHGDKESSMRGSFTKIGQVWTKYCIGPLLKAKRKSAVVMPCELETKCSTPQVRLSVTQQIALFVDMLADLGHRALLLRHEDPRFGPVLEAIPAGGERADIPRESDVSAIGSELNTQSPLLGDPRGNGFVLAAKKQHAKKRARSPVAARPQHIR